MPVHRAVFAALLVLATAPVARAVTHLTYSGGPVLHHVKVVQVNWGTAGTFASDVTGGGTTTPTHVGDFLKAMTNSGAIDWLREYNTPTTAIGRGTFAARYTIAPSSCAAGTNCTLADTSLQAELQTQVTGGHLPAPDADTVYFVFFPSNVTITFNGQTSCVDFCAYHNTFTFSGAPAPVNYVVMPHLATGACSLGCGASASPFDNLTTTVWHEVGDVVTDPQLSLSGSSAGWYDSTNGEIGDPCFGMGATVMGPDGAVYTIQKLWSNQRGTCFTATPWPLGDANGDMTLTIADVFYLINNLFTSGSAPIGFSDVNTDGQVTIADVFYTINYLFTGGPAPF